MVLGQMGTEEIAVIISLVALIQPWIYFLWAKSKSPTLEVYPRDLIEVGFANLGNTLILAGTLRAKHSDFIVKEIGATLLFKDAQNRQFNCLFFRKEHISVQQNGDVDRKVDAVVPQAIHVGDNLTATYNVILSDSETLEVVRNDVEELETIIKQAKVGFVETGAENIQDFYSGLAQNSEALGVLENFNNHLIWRDGGYSLLLKFTSDQGTFTHRHEFRLSNDDIEKFLKNKYALSNELIGLPINFYHAQITSWQKNWRSRNS